MDALTHLLLGLNMLLVH